MARVLVTGGAGYVGSHTCKALAGSGHEPVVYDSLEGGDRRSVRWGPLEVGRIDDTERLSQAFRRHRPTAVLHFAAYIAAGESVERPGAYYHNNVGGSLALLRTMVEHGVTSIVFSSTAAVYGNPQTVPIPESHPKQPINPYGWSKLMVEQILADHGTAHGLRSVALRYFNAAGADPEGEIGECHVPETHLIPLVLQAAFNKRSTFTIFGTDYDTHDGTAIRDYIHVSDLAVAHVTALEYLLAGNPSTALNLGTGHGHSVREVIAVSEQVTGCTVPTNEGARRPGDAPVLVADPSQANQILDWVPRCSGITKIIESAARWERSGHWRATHSQDATVTS